MATNTVTTGFLLPAIAWGNQNIGSTSISKSYVKAISDDLLETVNTDILGNTNQGSKRFYNNGQLIGTNIKTGSTETNSVKYNGKHSFEIIASIQNSTNASNGEWFVKLKNGSDSWEVQYSNDFGYVIRKNGTQVFSQGNIYATTFTAHETLKVRAFFFNDGVDKIVFEMWNSAFQGQIASYVEQGNAKNINDVFIGDNINSNDTWSDLTIWNIENEISSGKNLKDNIGTSNDFQKQRFEFPLVQKSDDPNNQNIRFWEASATDWTPTPSGSTVFDVLTDGNPNTFAEVGSAKTGLEQTNVDARAIPFNTDGSPFVFSKIVQLRQLKARVADDDAEQVNFQIQAPTAKQTDGTTNHTIQNEQTATLTAPIGQSGFMSKTWDFSSEPIDASLSDLRGSMNK